MDKKIAYTYQPTEVSYPGETLEELLEERYMTQAELAERMGRPKKTINEIIQGKAALTPETALQLERVLGVSASFWIAREQHYREYLARKQEDQALLAQTDWLTEVPVESLIEAGWIVEHTDRVKQLRETLGFYGIASPAQYSVAQPYATHSKDNQSKLGELAAWLRQGERLAQSVLCMPYHEERFRTVLEHLRQLTNEPVVQAYDSLMKQCADAGVIVVIVPELAQIQVYGSARWLTSAKAMIQLSDTAASDIESWLHFFHLAGHIVLHGKRDIFVDQKGQNSNEREYEADRFALQLLNSRISL